MKKILLSIAGACVLANPSALLAQTCTAGQLDVSYGPNGSNGFVQVSPVMFGLQNTGETQVIDSSNAFYALAGAATDSSGNWIAGVIKLKPGGARDLDYGGFGSVAVPVPTGSGINSMTMDPQGRLVVAVLSADGSTLSFTRYLPPGGLDLTYGASGTSTITLPFTGQTYSPTGIAAGPDGSIVYSITFSNPAFRPAQPAVLRLTPTGALDTSFGTNGFSMFYPSIGKATDVRVLADGTIIVGGRVGDNSTYEHFMVARLLANGSLDPSFGTGGTTIIDFGGAIASGRRLAIQSNGKIVLAGSAFDSNTVPGTFDIALVRLKTNGSIDTTFSGGMVRVPLNNNGGIDVALQNNDKILVNFDQWVDAAQTQQVPAVARFTASGQLDTAFGSGGVSVIAAPPGFPQGQGGAIGFAYDGKILVHIGGYDPASNRGAEFVVRLDAGSGAGCH